MSKTTQGRWRAVRKDAPCAACGKTDWCAWSPDGAMLRCMRNGDTPAGMGRVKADAEGGTLYAAAEEKRINGHGWKLPKPPSIRTLPRAAKLDLSATMDRLRRQFTTEHSASLAASTGIPAKAWAKLGPGWCVAADLRLLHAGGAGWDADGGGYPDVAFAFLEHDGRGQPVGLPLRTLDGRKGAPSGRVTGCQRGLIVPPGIHEASQGQPILIVEGASDVAACVAMGLPVVGRPSNRAGASDLADLLEGMDVLVVGERDGKDGGAWPGRDGAKVVAGQLAGRWGESVSWTLPPVGVKDLREWFKANAGDDATGAGVKLLAMLTEAAKKAKPAKRSTADVLVDLALLRFRLGRSEDGESFAVEHEGPAVALLFRGGASALRARLSKLYRDTTGKTPNASALADALVALEGQAMDSEAEPVSLRLEAHHAGDDDDNELPGAGIVLDLGDAQGRAVRSGGSGVEVLDVSPVLFRRTALTGVLPTPADDVTDPAVLHELRDLLNVGDDAWPLVVGWLVASLIPDIPHPVLMLGGEQGTGKSTAARLIVGLVDPSPALLRSEPRDTEGWALQAAGSWCVVIDNVSRIPGWWSDALCKAVTGDGWVRRKLYTDSDLSVLTFRRCVVLTSIDAGAMRGDLGDRLLLVDLDRIDETQRRTEADLDGLYAAAKPRLLAALLWAVSRTLAKLPAVKLDTMPRMADFARVLAALDAACPELTGGRALELFVSQRGRIAADVVESDAVASAVVKLIETGGGSWTGTAGGLLNAITPDKPPKDWPKTGRGIVGPLKRITPALRQVGVEVRKPEARSARGQTYTIERVGGQPSQPSQPSPDAADGPETRLPAHPSGDGSGDGPRDSSANRHTDRHIINPRDSLEPGISDSADGCDGSARPVSDSPRRRVRI